MAEGAMRLDRWLWWARIVKTRSAAQALCRAGHLRIDGRAVDCAHAAVREGQVLTFMLHDRMHVLRVTALPGRRGPPAEARGCYDAIPLTPPEGDRNARDVNAFGVTP